MLNLASDTAADWVPRMLPHLDVLLLDHAHCEKKAASTAINLIFRYQDKPEIMRPLSEVAREELEHFEQMLDILADRGIPFAKLEPSPYAGQLRKGIRRKEPHQLIDTLLCCALIEARSCERMRRLSEELPDAELAGFYKSLLESEARHHMLYVRLAERYAPRSEVYERLAELAALEAQVLADSPADLPRMHT